MSVNHRLLNGALGLLLAGAAAAGPSSHVAWTPGLRALATGGDASRGKETAQVCDACHSDAAKTANSLLPALDGQMSAYTFKQVRDFRDERRVNTIMQRYAKGMSDQELADVAAWYAEQALPAAQSVGTASPAIAERLVWKGDARRFIPPCAACHGGRGQGKLIDVPALAGQGVAYLIRTMQGFKSGRRDNDVYGRMRLMMAQLTDEEIGALAAYYAGLSQ